MSGYVPKFMHWLLAKKKVIFKSERNVQVNDQKLVKSSQIAFDKELLLMFVRIM